MSDQTLIEYLRDDRPFPTTPDRSLDDVALASALSAYTLTQALNDLWEKRRACLETVASILCPFPVGTILDRTDTVTRRYVVVSVLPCTADYSAPYLLRCRILKADGTLGDREQFLKMDSSATFTAVGQFAGDIPASDWIEDRRI